MEDPLDHEHEKIERLRRAMYSRTLENKLRDQPRHNLEEEQSSVREDWQRTDPTFVSKAVVLPPAMLGYVHGLLRLFAVLSILFFVGAVGFAAYYFVFGAGSTGASSVANIDIAIVGPTRVSGGEVTQLQIMVTNRNPVPIELADLVFSYPTGTRSPTDFKTDLSNQRISLGTIEPGGRRQGVVSVVFAGDTNTAVDVKADLEYHLHGSSAIFVAHSDYSTALSSSPLSLAVDGKSETISGQPLEFTVTVSSNTSEPIRDVLLSAQYPFGFKFSSASPAPKNPGVWELGDLAPGQQRTVTIRGVLTGTSGDERTFNFSTGTRTEPENKNVDNILSNNAFKMHISEPFLGLALLVNEAETKDVTVTPGSEVKVSVQWQNNLQTTITDAVIVARVSGIQIDGSAVQSADGFFRSTDGTMLWDKTTTNGTLATLEPGARGKVSFSFKMPSSDELQGVRNPSLSISVNAAGKRVAESGVPQSLQSTASAKIALASDLQVKTQGYYNGNLFGSTGPMPPKAGSETTYAAVFTVTNTTNRVTNAKLTARLPAYVRWTGIYSPSSEKITFNQNEGVFTWDLGTVEPNVGLNGTQPRQALVTIGVTPSTSQIGQEPVIIQDVTFTGTDQPTGASITRNPNDITTNIVGDPGFVSTNATVVR